MGYGSGRGDTLIYMQIAVDLTDEQLETLTKLGEQKGVSSAALVLEAVTEYLNTRQIDDLSESFGLWHSKAVDGVQYQKLLRDEWER